MNSLPWSTRIDFGNPNSALTRSSVATTSPARSVGHAEAPAALTMRRSGPPLAFRGDTSVGEVP
jgi:hypothetical protein